MEQKKIDFSQKKIVRAKIVMVYGLPGEGKTFYASFISYFYRRVYSNVDFYDRGKKKNITINTMLDLEKKIKYSDEKGLLIIDEAGANNNSRDSMSERNKFFGRLAMYCRKYNIDIMIISQLERMQDVYYREMAMYHFEMQSFFSGYNYIKFEVKIKDRFGNYIANKQLDLIKFSEKRHYTYNTLDKSLID